MEPSELRLDGTAPTSIKSQSAHFRVPVFARNLNRSQTLPAERPQSGTDASQATAQPSIRMPRQFGPLPTLKSSLRRTRSQPAEYFDTPTPLYLPDRQWT